MEMKLYEELRCDIGGVALFEPQTRGTPGAAVNTSAWLGVAAYEKVMFVAIIGEANDAQATLNIQVLEATSQGGAGAQVLKTATLITADAGFATLDQLVLIHVEMPEMTVNTGYSHLALRFTISPLDTWMFAAICIREEREWLPTPGGATEIVD